MYPGFISILTLLTFLLSTTQMNDSASIPPPSFDYEKAWKEVSEFESKGLPESALKVVNDIYKNAKLEKNSGQLVKAIIHQLKFTDYKEENAFITNLNTLKKEAEQASFPERPLLHSMLAEMYWQYYQNNRYEFMNRTKTVNFDDSDIETWSLDKIVEQTFQHYQLSLADEAASKKESIEVYLPVINKGNDLGRSYRPTLYDFLAHRALTFYVSQEPDITRPAYTFTLDKEEYLAPAADFIKLKLTTEDTLSMKFQGLTILQDLLQFHLNDKDKGSFVEVDLQRLQFVRAHLTLANKTELYLKALDALEQSVLKDPASGKVTAARARVFIETATQYNPLLSDDHKWDLKKAMEICEEGKKRFPDSNGSILCENIQEDIQHKSIGATIEATNVPGAPFRSLIKYKNFTTLHYRIIKVTRDEVSALRKKLQEVYNIDREQKFVEHFIEKKSLITGKYELPDDGGFQQHSIEVKLDALNEGEYMVLFSNEPDFKTSKNGIAYAFTVITNITYLHRTIDDGQTEFTLLHRQTGEPLAGVKAEVYTTQYNNLRKTYDAVKIGSYTSDTKGNFKIPFIKKDNHRSFYVNFSQGNDFNSTEEIDHENYYSGGSLYQYQRPQEQSHLQTFFFLDRAIYRPGQTIYFKGLVVNTDGKNPHIQTKYSTTITLVDVNSEELETLKVTTNEYGTFSGVLTAPSTGLMGEMRIETSDGSGSTAFSVEEYKRPKFEVDFNPVKGSFRLNENISLEGFAHAYSGANIDGAKVVYRVVRNVNFPFWWWCRRGYYPPSAETEIINGETISDENGIFKVDFKALPDKTVDTASDPTFTYTIYADVTDINGETHSSSTSVSVGYKALKVQVNTDNINKDILKDEKKEFNIITTNLAGEFEPAKGSIKIYSLKQPTKAFRPRLWEEADRKLYSQQEYYKLFPHDLYDDELNKFKWERDKEVVHVAFDTEKNKTLTLDNLSKWNTGEYVLEIVSKDKYDQEVKEVSYFTVYAPLSKNIPTPAVNYFQGIKLTAEPGEKASFSTGTSEAKITVLYEIEQDGKIISKEWLTLKNEQRHFEIPIKESYRGNIGVHYTFVKDNRMYQNSFTITVPYSNKELDISFESFRDKLLPGQEEEWKILIKGKTADKVAAEMVATLYDESLDEFRVNSWFANFYNSMYARLGWQSSNGFNTEDLKIYTRDWNKGHSRYASGPTFDSFNWFGYSFYSHRNIMIRGAASFRSGAAPMQKELSYSNNVMEDSSEAESSKASADEVFGVPQTEQPAQKDSQINKVDMSDVKVRSNFNETAFFYPHLQTNDKGEIIIKFTIPEALTRWKMLGFAHTKDLSSGMTTNHLVTQKDLMVVPNQPRFFRENDKMIFSTKISSLVDKDLSGQAQLEFFDALTMKAIDEQMKNVNKTQTFSIKPKQSTVVEWSIEIPEGLQAVMYRVVAKAGNVSDGEEMVLPVVTNRMLVTETLPLPIRGKQSKDFKFDKLINNKSTTLRHQRYTLEFTSNPAWYAIQALPYLMEYPYDCVEQTFSRFYANSIASHIANSNPKIKQVFDTWKNIQPDALLSNLEKNQELKSALLEETPWVLQAKDESQRKRMVGVLFDLNRMANEQERALEKIIKAQTGSGGFSWFPGFPDDRYMTQHIVAGLGHLDVMGVKIVRKDDRILGLVNAATQYMDREIKDDYDRLKALAKRKEINLEDNHINYIHFHYLYTRSYFKDIAVDARNKEAFDYFLGQAKKYWLSGNIYTEGMTCLALHRFGDKSITSSMIKSFSERSLHSEEMGMYWKNDRGYYWYQAPIETQALMIEVYDEVAGDTKSVEDLKVWLLKQKQTQDWKTTKATTEACYALLRRGTDILANTKMVDIKVGDKIIDPTKLADTKIEAGTGYFKTAWQANEITANMGNIHITKTDEGVAWGAVYWQYFEQLDKITSAETPLKLKKDLFLVKQTDRGPVITPVNDKGSFNIGDLVRVRIELRVDRTMEYVHLKDMRAATFEPVSTLSTYKFQDGLYYYESPRDLATNFFIGYLGKGTYVFEYDLRVSQKGDFSNGVTTIQCMYAPEFSSHSQGIRVRVDRP